jgi:hypothetical protein
MTGAIAGTFATGLLGEPLGHDAFPAVMLAGAILGCAALTACVIVSRRTRVSID